MSVRVLRVEDAGRDSFFRLHCDDNDAGWCRCIAWWVPSWDGWDGRTAGQNRALREELFDRGEFDGYLLVEGDEPLAWCQAGPRDRLEKLCRQYDLAPEPGAWAISCLLVAPSHRGSGKASLLLRGVLEDLALRGVRRIEAFPRRGDDVAPEDAWTGPERLFAANGFVCVRDDPAFPIYVLAR